RRSAIPSRIHQGRALMNGTIWTVGHSNRSIEDFSDLLKGESIDWIADVRRFNSSLRHPQFGRDRFAPSLAEQGIGYQHFEALGGRRGRRSAGSPNMGWRVEAFNAFADHMASAEFASAIEALIALATQHRVAIMCSEALPWRCHRRLISDALTAQ